MSIDQSFLHPQDQQKLFDALKTAGMLSQEHGQAPATEEEQTTSSGIGNIDYATLQSLIKHAVNPNSVAMQEGDKMHPMDAIQQLLGPKKPTGIENTGGPTIQRNAQGNQEMITPQENIIGKLLKLKNHTIVNDVNYFQAAQNAGIMQFLPSGLAQTPDGSPFVPKATFEQALAARKSVQGQGGDTYQKDELLAQGVPEDVANKLYAAAVKNGKAGVSTKELANYMGSERIKSTQVLAEARATMAGVAKLGQALKVGGFDAAQPMAELAGKNLGLVEKAQPLIDQINANGGKANIRQQNELSAILATLAGNSSQLTDARMNEFMPQTAMKQYGSWKEYFSNKQEPIDFSGFIEQMQDLLTREKVANQGVMSAASQLGLNIMGATGQPKRAEIIGQARANTPLISPPKKASGAWRVVR